MKKTIPALKPYLEEIRSHCEKLSADEMIDFICDLGLEKNIENRQDFLEMVLDTPKIQSTKVPIQNDVSNDDEKEILNRIELLKESIVERMESIEDGSYYDHQGYEDYRYDEEPDYLSEEDEHEIELLFSIADRYFLNGEFKLAEIIYGTFFRWFGEKGDEDFLLDLCTGDIDTNWRESAARFFRTIYETTSGAAKVETFLEFLEVDAKPYSRSFSFSAGDYPLLQEVFDAHPTAPINWNEFLNQIKIPLADEFSDRGQVLYLETLFSLEGIESVKKVVQDRKSPIGYLVLLEKFIEINEWEAVSELAEAALKNMKNGEYRVQVAEILTKSGENLKNDDLILTGKREAFYSVPNEEKFITLIEEAKKQNVKAQEIARAIKVLKTKHKDEKRLLIIMFFSLGRIPDAYEVLEEKDPVGWSYDSSGIVIFTGGILVALINSDSKAMIIPAFLKKHCSDYGESEEKAKILSEIQLGLKNTLSSEKDKIEWFDFAKKIIEERVDNIVSNQHRKAYDRAAEVLGALIEAFILNEKIEQAVDIFELCRNDKYRQFSAFKRELDDVVKKSVVLREYCRKS